MLVGITKILQIIFLNPSNFILFQCHSPIPILYSAAILHLPSIHLTSFQNNILIYLPLKLFIHLFFAIILYIDFLTTLFFFVSFHTSFFFNLISSFQHLPTSCPLSPTRSFYHTIPHHTLWLVSSNLYWATHLSCIVNYFLFHLFPHMLNITFFIASYSLTFKTSDISFSVLVFIPLI